MTDSTFIDSNVLVYLYDHDEPAKRRVAVEVFSRHVADGDAVLSVQVLGEFYVTTTRKLRRPLSEAAATEVVRELAALRVVPVACDTVLAAVVASRTYRISYRDALIVETARAAGCSRVISEDLNDGQDFDGVQVENPFLARADRRIVGSYSDFRSVPR
jgi:predicted nucleic acid-binding protein